MAGSEDYDSSGLYDRAIRGLSGVRDWWSAPRPPLRLPKRDVNLPAPGAVEKPWYEKIQDIPDITAIAERVGQQSVEPVKAVGGKLAGALGATSEGSGRAFGALMDATSTGSEQKPLSDVVWEGLKGVKSGYEAGLGATSASQEFTKRAPEETLRGANPVQRGMLGLGLDVVTDPTNLVPEKYLAGGAAALVGAGDVGQAWLPWAKFAKARNIEGLTHKVDAVSDAPRIINEGFDLSRQSIDDVIGRLAHAGYYSPEQAKELTAVGKIPSQRSNTQYRSESKRQIPIGFEPETKVLDLRAPVPREDFDEIVAGMDPVLNKSAIDDLEHAWQDQAKYAEGPEAVTHSAVRAGTQTPEQLAEYYKKLEEDPVASDAIERLNALLHRPSYSGPYIYGARGGSAYGNAPMNQPSMPTKYGAVHYSDYSGGIGRGDQGSIAFNPDEALVAPPDTQADIANVPWVKGKSFRGQSVPIDAPVVGSLPTPPVAQQAEEWAAQNISEPFPGSPWTPEELAGKFDVFNLGDSKTIGTFNTEAEATAFINKHPEGGNLGLGPYDPTYDPVVPPALKPKKVLGAKAQGEESMGVKLMQISLKNDDADDVILVWDNLPTKDQIYFKNAQPDEYQKILDLKNQKQSSVATLEPEVEAPPAGKTLDEIIYELEHSGFDYDEAVALAPQILKEQGAPTAVKEAPKDFYDDASFWGIPDDVKADLQSAGSAGYDLKESDAALHGMHSKDIYSKGGQDYIFKPNHSGPEFVPLQEKTANDVATLAGMYPIEMTVEKLDGRTGTMQPIVGNKTDWPSLRSPGQKIEKLTTSQLKDIIKNHPVDWLTANHDAHRGQWLITPQGIIEIDRGQAFKYFGKDKLDPTYNPNAKYGEEPSIYGGILKLWKEGKLPQLDQKDIEDAVRGTASKISENGDKIITELGQALERAGMKDHLPELYRRFNNVEEDILEFWKK